MTPLLKGAMYSQSSNVIKALLDAGANPDVRGGDGSAPLHWAVTTGNLDVVKVLLDAGVNPNTNDEGGMTPLHTAARRVNDNSAILEALLAAGADSSAKDDGHRTPWNYAKDWKDPEILEGHDVYRRLHDGQF